MYNHSLFCFKHISYYKEIGQIAIYTLFCLSDSEAEVKMAELAIFMLL